MKQPWDRPELKGWHIVGMNHYRCTDIDQRWRLYVAMVKDGRCIKEEGLDTPMIWMALAQKAQREE